MAARWPDSAPRIRTRPGERRRLRAVPMRGELVSELLDGDRLLPVLRLRRAAQTSGLSGIARPRA